MSTTGTKATPFVFRRRALIIAVAYGVGFFFGYLIQSAIFHHVEPAFVDVGQRWGKTGIEAAAWGAAGLAILAWAVRWWGSSYHSPGVVLNDDVVTQTFMAAGPYRYVRNPLYLGNVFLALGIGLLGPVTATIIVVLANLAIVYRLIAIEESYLREAVGEPYVRYCSQVPRLFPRLTPAPLPVDATRPDWLHGFITEFWVLGFAAATVFVALQVPRGLWSGIGGVFWLIAIGAIVTQAIASRTVGAKYRQGS
ncbi:MAG TPA: isoprenylcysteine carboxylmethyltransferase family protein [Candidatus Eremiobacteraceae bacterium]|nr:isoprenylcysteine carboxylmethyltransferase family protein [Candidatus Eremiobacteraceae bacterium]